MKNQTTQKRTRKKKIQPTENTNLPHTGFRLKITNLRTTAFPGPLEKTDYEEIVIGDIITKGTENTVYEVVDISRQAISEKEYTRLNQELNKYGSCRDEKAQGLIDLYKKSGNFGHCWISIRAIVRGGKVVAKGRLTMYPEIDNIYAIKYNGYKKITLEELIKKRDNHIKTIEYQLNRWKAKKNIQVTAKQALIDVLDKKKKQTKIEIVDHSGKVIESITPEILV